MHNALHEKLGVKFGNISRACISIEQELSNVHDLLEDLRRKRQRLDEKQTKLKMKIFRKSKDDRAELHRLYDKSDRRAVKGDVLDVQIQRLEKKIEKLEENLINVADEGVDALDAIISRMISSRRSRMSPTPIQTAGSALERLQLKAAKVAQEKFEKLAAKGQALAEKGQDLVEKRMEQLEEKAQVLEEKAIALANKSQDLVDTIDSL